MTEVRHQCINHGRLRSFCRAVLALLSIITCLLVLVVLSAPHVLPQSKLESMYQETQSGLCMRNVSGMLAARADSLVASLRGTSLGLLESQPIDVIVSGGGFRGQYAGGILSVLMPLVREGRIRVQRYAGASIGAGTLAHFLSNADTESFFRAPYAWQAVWSPRAFWRSSGIVWAMVTSNLPKNVSLPPGILSVPISLLAWPWRWSTLFTFAEQTWVSEFSSPEALYDALAASSAIPFFTGQPFFMRWKDRLAMDSGFTCHTPVFTDGLRPQLVVNLGALDYPILYTFSPTDPNHENLVMRGQDDIVALLQGPKYVNSSGLPQPLSMLHPSDPLLSKGFWGDTYRRLYLDLWAPVVGVCIFWAPVVCACTPEAAMMTILVIVATISALRFSWRLSAERDAVGPAKRTRELDAGQARKQTQNANWRVAATAAKWAAA